MDSICKATVGNYHSLIEFLMGCTTKSGDYFTDGGEEGIGRVRNELLPRFRNAKIFSIDPRVAVQVYDVIDQHVAESSNTLSPELYSRVFPKKSQTDSTMFVSFLDDLLGTPGDWEKWESEKNSDLYKDFICSPDNHASFPTKLPFDSMFIGYGTGVYLDFFSALVRHTYFKDQMVDIPINQLYSSSLASRGLPLLDTSARPRILGHYVASDGHVIEFLAMNTYAGEMLTYALMRSPLTTPKGNC